MNKHGWTYKMLGDVCYKGSSDIVIGKITDNNGDYPLFGATGFIKGIDYFHNESPYIGVVKDGSGAGRVDVYPAKSSLVGTMQYIFPKDNCNMRYLMYVLRGLSLEKFKTGAAIPHIYFRDYSKSSIPVPPIAVQEAIVAELDEINETIAEMQQQIADLDALAQSTFYTMFGDPITNEKGWEVKCLADISLKIANGYNAKLQEDTYKKEGIMYFRCQNVWRNRFDYSDMVYIDEQTNEMMKSSSLKHNDLLITKIGRINTENSSLGRVSLYEGEDDKANLSGNLCFIRLGKDVVHKYVLYILISNDFRDYIRRTTVGGIDKRALSVKQIGSFPIILPPIALQKNFVNRVEAIEAAKAELNAQIAEMQTLLASRMDYWFD